MNWTCYAAMLRACLREIEPDDAVVVHQKKERCIGHSLRPEERRQKHAGNETCREQSKRKQRIMQSGAAGHMRSGNCARDSVDEFGCGLDDGRKEKPISNDAGLRWGHLPRHRHRSESQRVRLGKDDEDREARCEEIHGWCDKHWVSESCQRCVQERGTVM